MGSIPAAKKGNTKGPLDIEFYQNLEVTLGKRKQTNMKDFDKKARETANQYIARFFYLNGIAFNVAKSKSFKLMVEAIGQYGPKLKPPSCHELRNPCLNKELENTYKMLETNKAEAAKYGCSIMSDGWTDTKGRTLINFLINSPASTMFIKSIDASSYVKSGKSIFEMLDKFVGEIGESSVVQLVTNNGRNYVLAGKLLQASRPKIFWTPCVAHCIDLILEEIGKIPKVKKVVAQGISLVGFIYNHSLVLNLLWEKAEMELIRHGVTSDEAKGRKATAIVLQISFWEDIVHALKAMGPLIKVLRLVYNEKIPAMGFVYQAMVDARNQIKKNFGDNESKYKPILEIVDRRWSVQLHHLLYAAGHYLNPKHFYDNPQMENDDLLLDGLYECIRKLSSSPENMDDIHRELSKYKACAGKFRLKEAIRHREDKHTSLAEWWKRYGSKTSNLQLLAIKILSLTCSSSGRERNWSTFEHIHSKKRNRLKHEMLQKLVFVKYNQTLKEHRESDEYIDPVIMDDPEINVGREWLLGDEVRVREGQSEVVYDDDDLGLLDVEEASGAAEPIFNTRSQAALLKAVATATTHAAPPPSKSKGKQGAKVSNGKGKQGEKVSKGRGKQVVVVDEYDLEFVNDWGDEEKEDEEGDIEDKEDEAKHMNDGGNGSDNEDFHDY
ncbi:uncharacterized protein [Medicago truncatula]|uniref:uncharacterized protein n=1 Tax=Medicago truncatula TaxID=3880 RepID=UPI000D2F3B76|nr:uncharacterized protein LOC112419243 [Medicago truncatula]